MSMKCQKLDVLKTLLKSINHSLGNGPNGQSIYRFDNGLVVNVYETGAVVFQGEQTDGVLAKQIKQFIESANAPFTN